MAKGFELPTININPIEDVDTLNISFEILEDLTPWKDYD
jgi:hypothetical protein